MLEDDAKHLGTEADVSSHILDMKKRDEEIPNRTNRYGSYLECNSDRNKDANGI